MPDRCGSATDREARTRESPTREPAAACVTPSSPDRGQHLWQPAHCRQGEALVIRARRSIKSAYCPPGPSLIGGQNSPPLNIRNNAHSWPTSAIDRRHYDGLRHSACLPSPALGWLVKTGRIGYSKHWIEREEMR